MKNKLDSLIFRTEFVPKRHKFHDRRAKFEILPAFLSKSKKRFGIGDNMSEKIVLIDGHSILNRAFYGIPDLTNAEGLHTNAVYGFLTIMFRIMEEEQPAYLAVAFDVHAPTFRHELYPEYKGTRKGMPDELREQVPVMKEVLTAMGIPIMEQPGMEADDILGTVAGQYEKQGMEVSVVSGDRDLLQLATDKIKIRIPKTKQGKTLVENYRAEDVEERYQVTPEEFIDLKALMGDASDNIPGVPGIGEKTATKIIVAYKSIENAYEHVEDIKPNRAREALKNHYDMAELSKTLATINTNCGFVLDPVQAEIGSMFTEEAYLLFKKLEFKNLMNRFDQQQAPANKIEEAFKVVTDFTEAEQLFAEMNDVSALGFQIIEDQEILGISVAFDEDKIFYFKAEGLLTGTYLAAKLNDVIQSTEEISVLDLKHVLNYIEAERKECFFDAGIAAYLLNPLKSNYMYEDISKEYLDLMLPAKEDLIGKQGYQKAEAENSKAVADIACYMAYTAWAACGPLKAKLQETEMYKLFCEIEMPLVFNLFEIEKIGIKAEAEALKVYGDELFVRIQELEKTIYALAGEEFNINSPKQLGVVLFEHMGLPGAKKTKTGYSTAADVLDKLAPEHPIVADILEYRTLSKLKSTYADGLAVFIGADNRIHSNFNQTITATGRISSTEPNLQNIPIRMELGRLIRKVFVPEDGYIFVDADYSQIELRVLAHMSGDEALIKAYQEAQDIHRMTASQVFHTPFEEVTPELRSNAKAVNFGIVYGISSFGLSQDLSISRKEAAAYIEKYFETYPKVKQYLDELVRKAKEEGYVETMFGRRRPVPEIKSSNFMQRSFGERIAMNSPIQGTAADIIKIAMNRVSDRLKTEQLRSRLILQVHDELLIEAHLDEVEQVKRLLEEEMRDAAQLQVPLEVDIHTGTNWYEAK